MLRAFVYNNKSATKRVVALAASANQTGTLVGFAFVSPILWVIRRLHSIASQVMLPLRPMELRS